MIFISKYIHIRETWNGTSLLPPYGKTVQIDDPACVTVLHNYLFVPIPKIWFSTRSFENLNLDYLEVCNDCSKIISSMGVYI